MYYLYSIVILGLFFLVKFCPLEYILYARKPLVALYLFWGHVITQDGHDAVRSLFAQSKWTSWGQNREDKPYKPLSISCHVVCQWSAICPVVYLFAYIVWVRAFWTYTWLLDPKIQSHFSFTTYWLKPNSHKTTTSEAFIHKNASKHIWTEVK